MNEAQDGAETDVDCGGDDCMPCITGQTCAVAQRLRERRLQRGQVPGAGCDDQVKNGKETEHRLRRRLRPCPADEPCVARQRLRQRRVQRQDLRLGVRGRLRQLRQAERQRLRDQHSRPISKTAAFAATSAICPTPPPSAAPASAASRPTAAPLGFQDCNGDPEDGCEVEPEDQQAQLRRLQQGLPRSERRSQLRRRPVRDHLQRRLRRLRRRTPTTAARSTPRRTARTAATCDEGVPGRGRLQRVLQRRRVRPNPVRGRQGRLQRRPRRRLRDDDVRPT